VNKPEKLPQRVRFEADGTVSIATGKVELGQGISTALAQIAADELGVDLSKVRILPASTEYSPDEGVTSGSLSIQDGGKALRQACAELRGRAEKPAAEYTIVGSNAPRSDLPGKFAGRASYVQDMVLPGMLQARVIRPPRPFGKLISIPDHPGLVRDGSFVAVLAEREVTEFARQFGLEAQASGPRDLGELLKKDSAEWGGLVKQTGFTAES